MRRTSLIALVSIGASSVLLAFAAPEPQRYEVSVRLLEGGRLIAAPSVTTNAGVTAKVMSDAGPDGWSVSVTPNPANSPSGNAAVSVAADVEFWNGIENRRQVTTTVLIDEGETVSLQVRQQDELPAVAVEIKASPAQ